MKHSKITLDNNREELVLIKDLLRHIDNEGMMFIIEDRTFDESAEDISSEPHIFKVYTNDTYQTILDRWKVRVDTLKGFERWSLIKRTIKDIVNDRAQKIDSRENQRLASTGLMDEKAGTNIPPEPAEQEKEGIGPRPYDDIRAM